MVVTVEPHATNIGVDVLKSGGNAIDSNDMLAKRSPLGSKASAHVPPTKVAADTYVIHQVQPALGEPLLFPQFASLALVVSGIVLAVRQ